MQTVDYNGDILSKLSLGTVQFGLNYGIANKNGQPNIDDVKAITDYVQSNGVNCFDTASAYGESEEVLGKVLEANNQYIISKLKSENFINNLDENINLSFKKLQTVGLFGLLLHDSNLLYKWENIYSYNIEKLKKSNMIKYFGVSIYSNSDFEMAIKNQHIDIIQIPFNIFDQRAINLRWFEKAKENNKLIFIRSIYLQGLILMDKISLPSKLKHAYEYICILENICHKLNISKNQLALSYVNMMAMNSILLFGCDNLKQAEENIKNFNNLPILNEDIVNEIQKVFNNIPEDIYNPTKWKYEK